MKKFDRTGSRTITFDDFIQCCVLIQVKCLFYADLIFCLGYKLSPQFYRLVANKFDRDGSSRVNFDDFIQICVIIQVFTLIYMVVAIEQF